MNPPTRRIPHAASLRRWRLSIEHSMLILGSSMLLASFSAVAAPRISASYSIAADITDAAGERTASASYTNDGSLGGIIGISTVAAPAETAKHGYIAQLYEVTGLQLTATPPTVNESSSRQLSGAQLLDDNTTLAVPASAISWSVLSGPITNISNSGAAIPANVYQNTAASVQGSYAGDIGALGLTVLNTNLDNYGSYAADGINDTWQVQYFGLDNPLAGPLQDPDHDGQNNWFEFQAGLVPTDPESRFLLNIESVPGQPGQKNIIFSPRLTGRNYTVLSKSDLAEGTWLPLASSSISDQLDKRTVTDLDVSSETKFYHVQIYIP